MGLYSIMADTILMQGLTIFLLVVSNIFMTFAWYGHLRYRSEPILQVILVSWGIAFFEYCFHVPANRLGSYYFSVAQLKTIQEVITLTVFCLFSAFYLEQPIRPNHIAGFGLIILGAAVIFLGGGEAANLDLYKRL